MKTEPTPLLQRLVPEPNRPADRHTPRGSEEMRAVDMPVDWQHLWFAIARRSWSALAIVPAHPSLSSLATARRLVSVGQAYSQTRVHLVDASSSDAAATRMAIAEVERHAREGSQCVVAVASPITRPGAIAVVRAAGAALLLVPLGKTEIRVARQTIACIGREHFLGAISTHGGS
jgi:hypothetical protein